MAPERDWDGGMFGGADWRKGVPKQRKSQAVAPNWLTWGGQQSFQFDSYDIAAPMQTKTLIYVSRAEMPTTWQLGLIVDFSGFVWQSEIGTWTVTFAVQMAVGQAMTTLLQTREVTPPYAQVSFLPQVPSEGLQVACSIGGITTVDGDHVLVASAYAAPVFR